jgi:hypothetical protein
MGFAADSVGLFPAVADFAASIGVVGMLSALLATTKRRRTLERLTGGRDRVSKISPDEAEHAPERKGRQA